MAPWSSGSGAKLKVSWLLPTAFGSAVLLLAAFLIGGRYTVVASSQTPAVYVLDRFTGDVRVCFKKCSGLPLPP